MRSIQVLVTGARGLLRDIIVDAVGKQRDMTVLPERATTTAPLSAAQRTDADAVVLISDSATNDSASSSVRAAFPPRLVLEVSGDGRKVHMFEYRLRSTERTSLDRAAQRELSPSALLAAIRSGTMPAEGRRRIPALGSRPLAAAARQLLLSLSPDEASFARRDFYPGVAPTRVHLERLGRTFLTGYNAAVAIADPATVGHRLDEQPREVCGFAYEGAAMAFALMDFFAPWRSPRIHDFVLRAPDHVYMTHVGVGWAVARLRLDAERVRSRHDPLLGWLLVDGFGFHEGYFHPRRFVAGRERPRRLFGYARRVFDHGLGRSLWFVECADVRRIAERIASFEPERRSDLWSGVGLACGYAGGVDVDAIRALRTAAGPHAASLAQGAAFAAKARLRARNPTANLELACAVLCGTSAQEAAEVTDVALAAAAEAPALPRYESWRRAIAAHFASTIHTGVVR